MYKPTSPAVSTLAQRKLPFLTSPSMRTSQNANPLIDQMREELKGERKKAQEAAARFSESEHKRQALLSKHEEHLRKILDLENDVLKLKHTIADIFARKASAALRDQYNELQEKHSALLADFEKLQKKEQQFVAHVRELKEKTKAQMKKA